MQYADNKTSSVILSNETEKALTFIWNTKGVYRFHVRSFITWMKETNLDFSPDAIKAYFIDLNNSSYAANTIRIKRCALKSAIKKYIATLNDIPKLLLMDRMLKQLDSSPETRAPKLNDSLAGFDNFLTLNEVNLLLNGARSARQRAWIEFLYVSGCRISEALNIKLTDLKEENSIYYFKVIGKGRKERNLYIEKERIDRIIKIFGSTIYLFQTTPGHKYTSSYVSGQLKKIGKHVLGRKISAHTFRHSCATSMLESGIGILEVSQWLGHSSLDITKRYLHKKLDVIQLKNFTHGLTA